MRHVFIVNPHAGAQSCEALVREVLRPFQGQIDCDVYVKQYRGDSLEVVQRYRNQYPGEELRFYACGGDGTLREVAIACIGVSHVAFTAFAQGSGNDYVKYYGGAANFRQVERLLNGTPTPIDMMRVRSCGNDNDAEEISWALNATHFGLDAKVAVTMDKLRRMPFIGKRCAYPTSVVWGFLTGMKNKCNVWADGRRISLPTNHRHSDTCDDIIQGHDDIKEGYDDILLCTAANGTHVGGSYCCAPRSLNDDGQLEVCLVHPIARHKFLSMMKGYKQGRHLDDPRFAPYLTYLRAQTLTIEGPQGFCVSLDGEILSATHIEIENIRHAVTFIKPAGAERGAQLGIRNEE